MVTRRTRASASARFTPSPSGSRLVRKTSTKEILAHLLSARYEVLKTPRSTNTIAGVCRVARQDLQPRHQYFVVELGAYKAGEIARICRLVQPSMGILTAVGPQHLERFRTIEAVARAKNELLQALPSDGIAIVNGDDPIWSGGWATSVLSPYGQYGLEHRATWTSALRHPDRRGRDAL